MTYTNWTEKHLRIALQRELTPSARDLYEYLVLEGYEGKPQVLDLREFNKFILKRRGKAYDRRTIKSAQIFLENCGLLTACKKFTAFVHHVTLRCVSGLFTPKKQADNQCKSRSLNATLQPSNGTNAAQEGLTTTTNLINQLPEEFVEELETNLELCEQAGIFYDSADVPEILAEDPQDVKAAIAYYKEYSSRKKVRNPQGFLRKCLQRRWWESKGAPSFTASLIALAGYLGVTND
jgi:hypothetical protein